MRGRSSVRYARRRGRNVINNENRLPVERRAARTGRLPAKESRRELSWISVGTAWQLDEPGRVGQ